jgi:2-dehydro-3-deoxyphosphogluconate aldolase/(4S)-4-hydroxy-2-oxoglutarate aldolase
MSDKEKICERLESPGIIAVVRAKTATQVIPLSEALIGGGIIAIEITMTTRNAIEAIREAANRVGGRALIGVGTVLDAATTKRAIDAGAQFVVSPITKAEIAQAARENNRPCMLGAYTPTEAQLAYESGADYIKLFPAENLGPAYIKAIRAPLPHLKIIPTGGIDLANIASFFQAGCSAVGVGSSMLSPKLIEAGNWGELTRLARQFLEAAGKLNSPEPF